jgi:hypothetical protein
MGLFASKAEKQDRAIAEFWEWFRSNAPRFADGRAIEHRAIGELAAKLGKIHKGLVFQLDTHSDSPTLEVSADGIRELFPVVRKVVGSAPEVPGWNVVAFRQPARDPSELQLEFNGVKIEPSDIAFVCRSSGNRARVVIFAPTYEPEVPREMIGAVFILLDATLGEYAVETKVQIDGILPKSKQPAEARPLPELAGVLLDVAGDPL